MRLFRIRLYVVVILAVILMLVCPKSLSDALRDGSISTFSPIWRGFKKSSMIPTQNLSSFEYYKVIETLNREKSELEKENKLLSSQLVEVQKFLFSKELVENDFELLKALKQTQEEEGFSKEFLQRRHEELQFRLSMQLESVDAKVMFREPSSWSSSLWVDKGLDYNELLGVDIILENSPVVIGSAVVGVIEYVGRKKSKVRLITDEKLYISVRAIRGSTQNRFLHDNLSLVLEQLKFRKELFFSEEEQINTLKILEDLSQNIQFFTSDCYMAKGEIHGSSLPLWRCRSQKLKGVGFNYDFDDEEGPSRDLRSGRTLDQNNTSGRSDLIKEGDLLVTTGMDGVFPAGFKVGLVTKIHPLEEGSYCYDLDAKAIAAELDEIEKVTILAPLKGL